MEKQLATPKILIVDDDTKACINLKRILKGKHYLVEVAYGGEEALAKINEFSPHIVLLDIRMPGLSGDELVKMIKNWKPQIEVIMTTAVTDPGILEACISNGAFACLEKPIRFENLSAKIDEALEKIKNA